MIKNESKIRLTDVNEFITCVLCKGYLIDATTITECLHTFCKKCIVTYLEDKYNCPICDTILHQSHPYLYIAHDRTMQSIVYSIVSNLEKNELDRQVNFYRENNLEFPPQLKEILEVNLMNGSANSKAIRGNESNLNGAQKNRNDEQIMLGLEPLGGLRELPQPFIMCSCNTTVTHLKKYVALTLYANIEFYKELDMLLDDALLGKEHTLKFIQLTYRKNKEEPLLIYFRPKIVYN